MSKRTNGRIWGMLTLLLLVLPVVMLLPAGSAEEGMVTLKVTVIDEVKDPIDDAMVYAVNVHSGTVYDLDYDMTNGYFMAFVMPGTYELFGSAEGYVSDSMIVEKLDEDGSGSVFPITLTMMSNEVRYHFAVFDQDMEVIEGASVHVFGTSGFHKMVVSDEKGWANLSGPEDFHLLVFAEDMLTYSQSVMLVNTTSFSWDVIMTHQPSGKTGSYRVLGFVKEDNRYVPDVTAHVWDVTNDHMVPVEGEMDGSISLPLYDSEFRLLVEAAGYEPYWVNSIDLTDAPNYWAPSGEVFEMTPVAEVSSKVTTVDLSQDVNAPVITTEWTLDANSRIYGFDNTFGTPRMQVSGPFYSSDWLMVDSGEAAAVTDALLTYGPAWMMTRDFLMVNGEHYTYEGDFAVETEGFEGPVSEAVNPVVTMTQGYTGEIDLPSGGNMRVEIFTLLPGEKIVVKVPDNYEILGEFGDKAEFPYMGDTSMIVVFEPLEFNAKKEIAPEARISFTNAYDFFKADDMKYVVSLNENVTLSGKSSSDVVGRISSYGWTIPAGVGYKLIKGNLSGPVENETDMITLQFTGNSANYANITLTVTDSAGAMSEKAWINIKPDGAAPAIEMFTVKRVGNDTYLDAPYSVDEDVELEFNASDATDNSEIANYVWTFGDGSGSVNGEVVKYRFTDPGTFNISLKLVDVVGNEKLLENVTYATVKDITKPMAVIKPFQTSPRPVIGLEIELNATQSYDPRDDDNVDELALYTWTWEDPNDDNETVTLTGKVVKYTFERPGVYTINLTVTDEAGLTGWTTRSLDVGGPNLAVVRIDRKDPEAKIREGEKNPLSIVITNNGETAINESWTLKVYLGKSVVSTKVVDANLGPGEMYYHNFSLKPKSAKNQDLKVVLDTEGDIDEKLEGKDNELVESLSILPQESIIQWWWFLVALAILVVVYVVFMKVTKNQWGYEPIMDWWNNRKKD